MALPALHGLARLGSLTIHAPRWGPELYAEVDATVVGRGHIRADIAVLFAPSLRAAWEARGVERVIGTPTDHRRCLLTDPVAPATHQAATYEALARAAGAEPLGSPVYGIRGRAAAVEAGHIGLNPLSVGGITREWRGYRVLAERLPWPVVFYAGPGEGSRLAPIAGRFPRVVGTSLPDFAATLERCAVFVSNDSGAAHFARACGVPTVVIHGSTSAARTGPDQAHAIERSVHCHPCYKPTCSRQLQCLAVPTDRVLAEVEACFRS